MSDWFGASLEAQLFWDIILNKKSVTYRIRYTGKVASLSNQVSGTFTPELWKHDVVELFLGSRGSLHYLEINLAPSGAWWAQHFLKYREQDSLALRPVLLNMNSQITEEEWKADVTISQDEPFNEETMFHVTAILNGRFLSSHPVPGIEPDFHRLECFRSVP